MARIVVIFVVLFVVGYLAGVRFGLYGQHEGPGEVTARSIPKTTVDQRTAVEREAAAAVGDRRSKQILFGDLHVTAQAEVVDGLEPTIAVQHHHAHVAACLADNGQAGPVIGVAFDGLGYGTDGTLWGGEFLVADLERFERAGHLGAVPMPGGTSAIREPWRMAAAYLDRAFGAALPPLALDLRLVEQRHRRD